MRVRVAPRMQDDCSTFLAPSLVTDVIGFLYNMARRKALAGFTDEAAPAYLAGVRDALLGLFPDCLSNGGNERLWVNNI